MPRPLARGSITSMVSVRAEEEEEKRAGGIEFSPPVYRQRYTAVLELARKLKPRKVNTKQQRV